MQDQVAQLRAKIQPVRSRSSYKAKARVERPHGGSCSLHILLAIPIVVATPS